MRSAAACPDGSAAVGTTMFQARTINADHKDLIHDVAYDFYGRRMATCSSDQSVKVFDLDENDEWRCTADWKTHSGSVWKVNWAHPEFGQILATCSFDRTAAIWEEIVGESGNSAHNKNQSHWVKRTSLVDSRTNVTDIKFAPKHMGLLLAMCSADGGVRIYEAPDTMNLSQWSLQQEINLKMPASCLTWNPSLSRLHPWMLAVGSDDTTPGTGGKVFLFEYSENSHRWSKAETVSSITEPVHDIAFAPNLGRSYHILGVASKDVRIIILQPPHEKKEAFVACSTSQLEIFQAAQFDDHNSTVWRISWNITGTILASSGDDGCLRMWKANYLHNWKCIAVLKSDGSGISLEDSTDKDKSNTHSTTRYYKLGTIGNANQVPWH